MKIRFESNLLLMFGVTLTVVLGVSSIVPALPKLATEMQIPEKSIGLVITVFTLPGVVLAPLIGYCTDRFDKKKILVGSLVLFGLAGGACSTASTWETLLFYRLLQGVGIAWVTVLNLTIISELYSGEMRTKVLGYVATLVSLGAILFPLLGGILAEIHWRAPFIMPLASVPLALVLWIKLRRPQASPAVHMTEYIQAGVSFLKTRRGRGLYLLTFLSFAVLYGPFLTYLPTELSEQFSLSPSQVGVAISISFAFFAVTASQVGRLTTRFKRVNILLTGCAFLTVSMFVIPLMTLFWHYALAIALYGVSLGLSSPVRLTLLVDAASSGQRGLVISINGLLLRAGQSIAPVLFGAVLSALGMSAVFFGGAILGLVMFIVVRHTLVGTDPDTGLTPPV